MRILSVHYNEDDILRSVIVHYNEDDIYILQWILIWTTALWTMVRLNYCSFELLFIWTTDMTSYPVV